MENSVFKSTKQLLGIADSYTAFDTDILTHINSVLGILNQLGVGLPGGISVIDDTTTWDDLGITSLPLLNMCKSYMYLKIRLIFDPPTSRFPLDAIEKQLAELDFRIHVFVDSAEPIPVVEPTRPVPPGPDPNEEEWWALLP